MSSPVTIQPVVIPTFHSADFFQRAATRLSHAPPVARGGLGDDVLNPGFLLEDATYLDAAVLMPVVAREVEPTVLLTQRTSHLSSHPGQIAFPGGKIDATDADAGAAALREASEEIGLDPGKVDLIGYLAPYLTRTGYRIVPVLGRVDPGMTLKLNAHEVEEVFEVPLAFLMNPANHRRGSRVLLGAERSFYEMPYEGRYIWGVTAGIIRALYERVFA
jgi:8-oxo-dGTP pyrophosphatase MutT (NUDIX family)